MLVIQKLVTSKFQKAYIYLKQPIYTHTQRHQKVWTPVG